MMKRHHRNRRRKRRKIADWAKKKKSAHWLFVSGAQTGTHKKHCNIL